MYGDSRLRLYTGFHYMHYPRYVLGAVLFKETAGLILTIIFGKHDVEDDIGYFTVWNIVLLYEEDAKLFFSSIHSEYL